MVLATRCLLSLLVTCLTVSSLAPAAFLCGQYDKYTSQSAPYTFGNNLWGADGSGSQCLTVSSDESAFSATWSWSNNPTLVHSFPNVNLNSPVLPLRLSDLSSLNTTVSWSMAPAGGSSQSLSDISTSANVIFDMFLDAEPARAKSTTLPKYEVMVWIAAFDGRKPIGYSSSIVNPPQKTINGVTFTLYVGPNTNGQMVYSWLASSTLTNFNGDISPLLSYLWQNSYIAESTYLGILQFGTETFHSTSNVTFSATTFQLSVGSSGAPASSISSLQVPPGLTWVMAGLFMSWALSLSTWTGLL